MRRTLGVVGLRRAWDGSERETLPARRDLVAAAFAEFVATALFIFFGCGAAARNYAVREDLTTAAKETWDPAAVLLIAFSFGLSITALVFSVAHISGGHLNAAVTLSLTLVGKCHPVRALAYVCAQLLGAITGAGLLKGVTSGDKDGIRALDRTSNLGSNAIFDPQSVTELNALLVEAVGTFALVFVVLNTAIDVSALTTNGNGRRRSNKMTLAPIPIGFAVFIAHLVCIPLTGCSINPSRSFGPAVVSGFWSDHWIWWAGPLIGAFFASLVWGVLQYLREWADEEDDNTAEDKAEDKAKDKAAV
uniref:Aquaporin n=1 Tax=Coccolithus braarudii TaxID=221442 RepID=A0A7S0L3L3_9EUKA|mmetsp:Transcript_18466/g.39757  ORF Transcript_18466/g.39757 Transcript_18466/m.39757 type:complete len:305 (+) Transcript_18466:50-964(+)